MQKLIKKSAFTLLEVMLAMSMLVVTIVSIYNISSQVKASMLSTEDRVTALYLAQEWLEFMRNKRDSYIASSWNKEYWWNEFLREIYWTWADLTGVQSATMKIWLENHWFFVLEKSQYRQEVNSINEICWWESWDDWDDCIYEKITILKNQYGANDKTPRDYYRKLVIKKEDWETNIVKIYSVIYWENKWVIERFALDFKLVNITIY